MYSCVSLIIALAASLVEVYISKVDANVSGEFLEVGVTVKIWLCILGCFGTFAFDFKRGWTCVRCFLIRVSSVSVIGRLATAFVASRVCLAYQLLDSALRAVTDFHVERFGSAVLETDFAAVALDGLVETGFAQNASVILTQKCSGASLSLARYFRFGIWSVMLRPAVDLASVWVSSFALAVAALTAEFASRLAEVFVIAFAESAVDKETAFGTPLVVVAYVLGALRLDGCE